MKLLLDQNISWKLVKDLEEEFPETTHIKSVLSTETTDRDIWDFAKEGGFTVVTKDDDFEQRSVLYGHPPKIVWIRLGNCRTEEIATLILNSAKVIKAFGDDPDKSLLPIP
ncbi:MAG: DUF5615 family PIN-like protein [Acidobacteria bacterium]|nr:DUF5615 family PIN-like protein [Acidobacteriota bacterium]